MTENKKQKVDWDDIAANLWEHYRNYVDSLAESDDQGDIDELQELLEVESSHEIKPLDSTEWKNTTDLIPVLLSVAYYHLADAKISEYLATEGGDEQAREIQELIFKSLQYYPLNSASWSMGANFGRVTQRLPLMSTLQWYEQALEPLASIKRHAFALLDNDGVDGIIKEWVELLIVNQILGIEYEEDEGESSDVDNEDEIRDEKRRTSESENIEEEDSEAGGQYSASAVEGTARFMCATIWSMMQQHDRSMAHLKRFPFTHRLHPNVWNSSDSPLNEAPTRPPLVFRPKSGLLPKALYKAMTAVFAPKATYWSDSDYSNRGYYSYFIGYKEGQSPTNLIEEVIINHLLPRAKQVLDKKEAKAICGFEWWTHTRPVQANLGHNLHFDTDESMLAQKKRVTHPILSSVLYLTGGGDEAGGATIVLDQTPDSESIPESCWKAVPADNSFLVFPGNLLHGVLPCPGQASDNSEAEPQSRAELMKCWDQGHAGLPEPHRLTFMVGFWTRDVPSTMKERKLYGPCGPMPPSTAEHSWASEIEHGYESNKSLAPDAEDQMAAVALPKVSPVWEEINVDEDTENEPELQTPKAIDHRFFVRGAPKCFRDSLFEEEDEECQ